MQLIKFYSNVFFLGPFFRAAQLCVLTIVLSSSYTSGQNTRLLNYSVRDGLPSSEVYEIFQDSYGFIWFATDHGVVKFDGYELKVMTVKDELSDPVVFGFSEDDQHRIWFRTYSGKISFYEKGKIHLFKWNDQLQELVQNNLMYSLYSTVNETYFSTERILGKIDSVGKIEKEEIGKRELNIKITTDKKLIFGLNGLSNRVKNIKINGRYHPIQPTDTLTHNKVICSFQSNNKTLITLNSDIFEYNGSDLKKVFTGRAPIISLSADHDGYYWIGYSNNGVDRLTQENYSVAHNSTLLATASVTKVLQDLEGGFWFSTLEEGVYYSPNLESTVTNLDSKTRFATFNSGHAIIGDQLGNISTYDLKSGQLLWKIKFDPPTRSLIIDSKNQLWVSSNNTSIVELNTGKLIKHLNGSYTNFSLESDTTLWAVGGLRITKFNLDGSSEYRISNSIHLKILYSDSLLYASGRTGLEILDSRKNLITKQTILTNSKITSIISLDNELIMAGTIGNGFHLIDKNTFKITSFSSNRNFITNDVYYIQRKDSLVWISTEKGLLALDYKLLKNHHIQFNKTILNEFSYERFNFFTVTDNSIWAISDYNIKVMPIKNKANKTQPRFYYEWIKPDSLIQDHVIEIDHKSPIQLKFGFISFNNQNIYTRYRISKKYDWNEISNRSIELQSLSPGNYELAIEYSEDRSNWSLALSVPFLVHPPWWNTWYFRSAIGFCGLLIGVIIFKSRLARYKEKNAYLGVINEQQKKLLNAEIEATERERTRIAKDLHDGISIDLVSIKLMANRIANKINEQDALEIETHIQKTISEIKDIIYGLTPPGLKLFGLSAGLQNYISIITKNYPVSIKFDTLGEEIKDQQIGAMIFRIIQELITNSIKHAYCNQISIELNVSSEFIEIIYRDNGVGFDLNNIKPGLGLSNIQSRVDSLSGHIQVESDRTGTFYSISLPFKSL